VRQRRTIRGTSIAMRTSGMTIEIIRVFVDNPWLEVVTGRSVYVAAEIIDEVLGAVEIVAWPDEYDEVCEDRRLTCSVEEFVSVRIEVGTGVFWVVGRVLAENVDDGKTASMGSNRRRLDKCIAWVTIAMAVNPTSLKL